MAYNRIQAGRLLAAAELPVFEVSLGEPLAELTAAKLRVLIKRSRNMRDKAQDLLQRQRVTTRSRTGSKDGTSGVANERTAQKVRALGEALGRFENRLVQLEAAAERAASAKLRSGERLAALKLRAQTPGKKASAGGAGKAALASGPKSVPTASRRAAVKAPTPISLKSAVKMAVVATRNSQEKTASPTPARSAKARPTAPAHAGTGVPLVSSGADAQGMVQKRKFTGSQAIQAHVGAQGRRVQAKRDKR